MTPAGPVFTRAGVRRGLRSVAPLMPGVVMYGASFGVLSAAAGIVWPEALLFSAWVNAGGAQMAALQAWAHPLPIAALVLINLAMNSRYVLLGAALRPTFGALPARQIYPALFVLGDGNWALMLREQASGRNDAGFLFGSGLAMYLGWVVATMAGHSLGSLLARPERFAIDFVVSAFFATVTVGFYRGRRSLVPLFAGAAGAIVAQRSGAGPWTLLLGALAGSLVGLMAWSPPATPADGHDRAH